MSLNKIADVGLRQGEVEAALTAHEEGRATARDLAARDPANLGYQRDVYVSEFKLGGVGERLGDPAAAAALYRSALERNARLIEIDPTNADLANDRKALEGRLARASE